MKRTLNLLWVIPFAVFLFSANGYTRDGNAISILEYGSWIKLQDYSKRFDFDEDGKIRRFKVDKHERHLNNAKRIARYIHKHLLDSFPRLKFPFPCGVRQLGKWGETSKKEGQHITIFTQMGSGDGQKDSCTGQEAPGGWTHFLQIRFDDRLGEGEITYKGWTE